MEEIKVGEYTRNDEGYIGRIEKIIYDELEKQNYYSCEHHNVMASGYIENIVKHSPNIIDLIEEGDYVNGSKVINIAEAPVRAVYTEDGEQKLALIPKVNEDIKSVVTKEMFNQVKYEV